MIPPMAMWIRFRWFAIWIPLFLLWPIILAVWLLMLPFALLGMVIAGRINRFWRLIRLSLAFYELACATKGLQIDVRTERTTFQIALI